MQFNDGRRRDAIPRPWCVDLPDASFAPQRRPEFVAYLQANGRTGDDYATAELIFGELVGNAYLHAPGSLEVAVEWSSGHATLHVTDEGVPLDLSDTPLPDPFAEHGRGLAIVKSLAASLRTPTYPGFGKTVSVALPIRPDVRR
jgi:anti-sigma regulatory factor (Ser/Thr protein kinase)